jgi:hypothetical protein
MSSAVSKFGSQIGVDMAGNILNELLNDYRETKASRSPMPYEFWPDLRRKFSRDGASLYEACRCVDGTFYPGDALLDSGSNGRTGSDTTRRFANRRSTSVTGTTPNPAAGPDR